MDKKVNTVAIVSLSSGILGEKNVAHELQIGKKRLEEMGLRVKFTDNCLKGISYLAEHPEARARDLLQAYRDDEVDMILCAIGGDDTYRLCPYLFDNDELKKAADDKIFLGFSDTTMNHLMLAKLGARTFYGQSFLSDVCELDDDMLPYTRRFFEELITTGTIKKIVPSDVWYEERTDYSPAAVGTPRVSRPGSGWQLLQGPPVFSGRILGGCIDTLWDIFDATRYADSPAVCAKYGLFPSAEEWRGRILLLETSEERPKPELYERMLLALRDRGVFGAVSGVICGKPMDETYAEEYKRIIVRVIGDPSLPVLWDLNVGHATPRCVIPFGVETTVDADAQTIVFYPEDDKC